MENIDEGSIEVKNVKLEKHNQGFVLICAFCLYNSMI